MIRPLAEIADIERTYDRGVPSLGHAKSELLARWHFPLRDYETFLRLAFLSWYSEQEPAWLTGLESARPDIDGLITDCGGEHALTAEALFTLAFLWNLGPPIRSDEMGCRTRAKAFAERAGVSEPESRLFREWRFFLREADDTVEPRIYIEPEVHARYYGRGALGDYMEHMLMARLREGRFPNQPA